jgi:N-acetylneuraminic acid mutarotase
MQIAANAVVMSALIIIAGALAPYQLLAQASSGGSNSTDQPFQTPATTDLVVKDADSGALLSQANVGRTVVLSATVANNNITEIQFTSIFEIRAEDDVTIYLLWKEGTLDAGDYTTNVDLFWRPELVGRYEVRTFLLSSFENPTILSSISGAEFTIIEENENPSPSYSTGAIMPSPRSEMAAAAIASKIFVVGGSPGTLDTIEVYDVDSDSWISSEELDEDDPSDTATLTPLPLAVNHAAAASYDGLLYVVGGYLEGRAPSENLFIYDPSVDTWTQAADMPTPRAALTANFVNGKLYVVGGTNNEADALDTLEQYDPSTNTWEELPSMPTARQHLSSAVVDGKLYVAGGRTSGPSTNVDAFEVYDTVNKIWSGLESMPSERGGLAAAAIGNNLYVFGGESSDTVFDNNEKYDASTGEWTSEALLPTPRHGLVAVAIQGEIYLIGGGLEPTASRPATPVVEIYHP